MDISTTDMGLVARVQNLTKSYGSDSTRVDALRDVTIGIRRGEFTAIMGPSGSGKSTLMHIMAGHDGQHARGIIDATSEDADVIERRRKCNEPEPTDASIRRLDSHDAAESRGLSNRSARL